MLRGFPQNIPLSVQKEYEIFDSFAKEDFLSFDLFGDFQKPFVAWVFKDQKEKSCHLPLNSKSPAMLPEGLSYDALQIPERFFSSSDWGNTPYKGEVFFMGEGHVSQALSLQARLFPRCGEKQISFIKETMSQAVFARQTQMSALLASGTYPAVCASGMVMGLAAPVAREVGPLTGLFALVVGAHLVIHESMKKIRPLMAQGQSSLRASVALPLMGKSLATMLVCSFLADHLTTSFILYYFPHSQTKQIMEDSLNSKKPPPKETHGTGEENGSKTQKDFSKNRHRESPEPSLKNLPAQTKKPQNIREDFTPPLVPENFFPPLSGE